MKCNEYIEKWAGSDYLFKEAMSALSKIQNEYAKSVFDSRLNVTKQEALDEFWLRTAEYYGFKVDLYGYSDEITKEK